MPTPETEPCRPDSYYGITKHAAERYVHSTAERPDLGFDFSVTSLRMFSVYGPGQVLNNPYQGVLGIFSATCCAASRSPSSATASRRATSSTSTTSSTAGCGAESRPRRTAASSIWAAAGRCRSIELAEHVIEGVRLLRPAATRSTVRPARPGEQRRVQADVRHAQAVLGWQPRTSSKPGSPKRCGWARSEFAAPAPAAAAGGAAR